MNEEHYDIPWEFKNRGFAALRQRPHSTASPTSNVVGMSEGGGGFVHPTTSLKNTCNQVEKSENASISPPRSKSNQQIVQILHSPTLEQPTSRQPLANVKRTHFPVTTIASTSSSVNSTPNIEHRRRRSETAKKGSNLIRDKNLDFNYPHVRNHGLMDIEIVDTPRGTIQNKSRHKYKYDDSQLVHDSSLSRIEAEKLLSQHPVGVFLVRLRDEGNLALSLKSSDGVLHIKLEERDDRWVLGEGPSFQSISSCIRYYRKTELPIRGAELDVSKLEFDCKYVEEAWEVHQLKQKNGGFYGINPKNDYRFAVQAITTNGLGIELETHFNTRNESKKFQLDTFPILELPLGSTGAFTLFSYNCILLPLFLLLRLFVCIL